MKIQPQGDGFIIRTGGQSWLSVHLAKIVFHDEIAGFAAIKHSYIETQNKATARWFPSVQHAKNVLAYLKGSTVSCCPTKFNIEAHVGDIRLRVRFHYNNTLHTICKVKGMWAVLDDDGVLNPMYYLAPISDSLSEACRQHNLKENHP